MENLRGCQTAVFPIPAADVLGNHDGAARRDGGEKINEDRINHGVQTDACHDGLAGMADHHGVREADDHLEQLLNEQRDDHSLQQGVGKDLFFFRDLLLRFCETQQV